MPTHPRSALFDVFRRTGIVDRESFTLNTYDADTGKVTGHISAEDLADQILRALRLHESDQDPDE
ncbi:hypothetical protein OHV05_34530 [Kitasatospora sp. NBC_00070]|uniref:hypothetical protein n=1 Tax=Kitasatospora sp. NBC_00070 TaxID=2975962 RepID=UPI0032484637